MSNTNDRIITVRVSAGARTEKVEEIDAHTLRIRVQQPPEKGRANERVVELIAQHYHIPTTNVILVSGASYRDKRFLVSLPSH